MANFKQYTKKDGTKRWQFQAYLGVDDATGKPIKTTRRNFKTKKEAQLVLSRLQVDFENGGLTKENNDTFEDIYKLWFENYRKTVREATSIATERYMHLHVLPLFGNYKITKITPKMAQKAVNKWAEQLEVYKVVLQYAARVMDQAITLELINHNPFNKVTRPKIKKKKKITKLNFIRLNKLSK